MENQARAAGRGPTAFVLTHQSDPNQKEKGISLIALALMRSLGRKGVPVVRVHPNRLDFGVSSRYCRRLEVCPDLYASEQALVEFLLELAQRYPGPRVLFPASDDCVTFLARHHDRLRAAFRIVGPAWDVMRKVADKRSQYEHARALGIEIPETYFPADLAEVEALAGRLENYPYVIKPLVAHKWRLAASRRLLGGARKAFLARTRAELLGHYRSGARVDPNVMIQEVIGGRDERLFTFISCFDAESRPLAYCIRKKIRQMPIDFGYCTYTVSCHDARVEEQSLKLLTGIGFQGIAGVEWKLDPKTGALKLIEINARAMNTIGIAPACGVDIPYIAYRDALGEQVERVTDWMDDVGWIWLRQDVWAARKLRQLGQLTLAEWRKSLSGRKANAVYARDDLMPFLNSCHSWARELAQGALLALRRRTPLLAYRAPRPA